MKPFAVFLMLLCAAALAGTGYLYLTADMTVEGYSCTAYDALDRKADFDALKAQAASDSFIGTPFDLSGLGDAGDYQFYEYTLRLRNNSFLRAEVIEIQVTPMTGDVLQTAVPEEQRLSRRSVGDFKATILTKKSMHNVRELTVTWYMWGFPFSQRVTYSN